MVEIWNSFNEPQAIILSSLLTILAAIVGVGLGGYVFGGKVQDLKGALQESKNSIDEHEASVELKLSGILSKIKEVEGQLVSTSIGIAQLRGSVGDLESASSSQEAPADQVGLREQIREDWTAIRDALERMVADPFIDGRTRAKYARIDRRQYGVLLESYHEDFGVPNVTQFRRAMAIWQKYKNGRLTPSKQDLEDMKKIRGLLSPS